MSKLHDLITKLCPDGVPYRKLGEIEKDGIIKLGRGKVISKKDIANNPGSYPIYSASAINNGKFGEYGDYMFDDIRLTWSIDGGGRFFYRDDEKYSVTNVCGWLKVLDENAFNPKFLFYVLTSQWSKLVFNYTIKAHPSVIRNTYDIPMVPLPVQSEVVRILDSFTELEAELEAELAGRKEQYEYYRDRLLDEKNLEAMDGKPVETKKLGDICIRQRGTRITAKQMKEIACADGDILIFGGGKTKVYAKESDIPSKDVITCPSVVVKSRGNIGFEYCDVPFTHKSELWSYSSNDEAVNIKFISYYLENNRRFFQDAANIGKLPQIATGVTDNYELPVPSLATQKRIVDILDRFDALTTSLTDGIPAEIAMRREQYEYYRSRLLDFPRLPEDVDSDGDSNSE